MKKVIYLRNEYSHSFLLKLLNKSRIKNHDCRRNRKEKKHEDLTTAGVMLGISEYNAYSA
jgi:hypothetical protein